MIKERYRVEILDKKTKEKSVFLVSSLEQEFKLDLQPIHLQANTVAEWVSCGYESVTLKLYRPKSHIISKRVKKIKKSKSRKRNK